MSREAYKLGKVAAGCGFVGAIWCPYHAAHKELYDSWMAGNKAAQAARGRGEPV